MSPDILSLHLLTARTTVPPADVALRPVDESDRDVLARLYLGGYPPAVGAADLAAALQEMDATFNSAYGELRPDASLLALRGDSGVGFVLVTERSIWDADVDGPFIIDLVVDPGERGRGVGSALVSGAIDACRRSDESTLSLRTGAGTSAAAHSIYARIGFQAAP